MNYNVVISFGVWLGALAYYYIDARKWFTGPKITIDEADLTEEQEIAIREEGLQVTGAHTTKNGIAGAVDAEKAHGVESDVRRTSASGSGSGSGSGTSDHVKV